MSARCRTCTHWRDLNERWGHGEMVEGESWGSCARMAAPYYYDAIEPVIAYAQDGSDYKADLMCRSDFGCVLHEAMSVCAAKAMWSDDLCELELGHEGLHQHGGSAWGSVPRPTDEPTLTTR